MTTIQTETSLEEETNQEFQTGNIVTIVSGHAMHDTYSAFLAPLLPLLINKLSMSLAVAGSLQFFVQIPALLNPFIGYIADRVSVRYFIILAPAVSATIFSLLGLAPSYLVLAIMLFAGGISVAAFHAPAPAMISRISGKQIGRGMSYFMAGGELGRTLGPLVVAWSVSAWTLEGMYPVMVVGWLASFILYWRLRNIPARTDKPHDVRAMLPIVRRLFGPLIVIVFFRAFMAVPFQTFLPTLLNFEGASLFLSSFSLTIWELAGVAGALLGGTLSDRVGRKAVLFVALGLAPFLTLLFLQTPTSLLVPVLLIHGLVALSTNPVLMAITQEHMPNNRAVANGLFISITFFSRPVTAVIIGYFGDQFGLEAAYFWGALLSLGAIPAIFFLPELKAGD